MIESKRPNPELDTSVISKREQGEALNQVRNATYGIESKAEARIPTSEKVAIDSFWVNPLWPVNPFEIGTVKEKLPPKGSGRQVYDAEGKYDDRGFLARSEGQAPTGKKTVDTVYDNLGIVRDFYKKEFGRDGVDGRGKTYQATVNLAPFKERNYLFPGQVFWDGSRVCMVKTEANGIISNNTSVDIIGHEITHGVSAAEHSWNKTGQS